jgi:hypothetical protein
MVSEVITGRSFTLPVYGGPFGGRKLLENACQHRTRSVLPTGLVKHAYLKLTRQIRKCAPGADVRGTQARPAALDKINVTWPSIIADKSCRQQSQPQHAGFSDRLPPLEDYG